VTPITASLIAFAFMLIGTLVGFVIRRALPEHYLDPESKDVVKLSMGVVATLAALVLGLLVAAAHGKYEARSSQIKQITAYVIMLDRLLAQYGQGAQATRVLLRQAIAPVADRIWNENLSGSAQTTPFAANIEGEAFYQAINALHPDNEAQSALQSRIIQLTADLTQARLLLFTQIGSSIPTLFLAILIFWLTILFASFSLIAPPNPAVIAALSVCALSASGAIFLILELDQPFFGLMALSSEPLRNALAPLGP
jgi:hypothetical protein